MRKARRNKQSSTPHSLTAIVLLVITLFPALSLKNSWAGEPRKFSVWLSELREEAISRGIARHTLDQALSDVKPLPQVIDLDRNQPEFSLTFNEYAQRLVSDGRVKKGREKLTARRDLLAEISGQYGVPPHLLVALWGIETDFGRVSGDLPVIASLVTLAYDPRRGSFFRNELFDALHILDQGVVPFEKMKGSWAGAMGQLQFMPSVIRAYAIDYDKDGTLSIWADSGDLFATAANYLSRCGWERGLRWGREVHLPRDFDRSLIRSNSPRTLKQWQLLGIRRHDRTALPDSEITASIIEPDGPDGRAFAVYRNFEILLTWNRSNSFALSAGLLADRIAGSMP